MLLGSWHPGFLFGGGVGRGFSATSFSAQKPGSKVQAFALQVFEGENSITWQKQCTASARWPARTCLQEAWAGARQRASPAGF